MSITSTTKQRALALIDQLPDDANWGAIMHALYVGAAIDAGLADAVAGRSIPSTEVRARLAESLMQENAALRGRPG